MSKWIGYMRGRITTSLVAGVLTTLLPVSAGAEVGTVSTSYNLSGTPGLVDLPTAEVAPDSEFSLFFSSFGTHFRGGIAFQVTPRLSAVFRHTKLGDYGGRPGENDYFDRSFDLRYRLLNEGKYLPAVSIGLNDFIGTGLYSSEYVVATKSFMDDRLRVTGGVGWGRLAGRNTIGSLFGDRPPLDFGLGGNLSSNQWFRGEMSPFGGVSYKVNDKLTFKAEYSPDTYARETERGIVDQKTPLNFMLDYNWSPTTNLSLFYLHGDMIGGQFSFNFNPRRPAARSGNETAPLPVKPRGASGWDQQWITDPSARPDLQKVVSKALKKDGQRLQAMALSATEVEVQLQNLRYHSPAQAVGRAARILTRAMPASVETFRITLVDNGVALSTVVLKRSDVEALEHSSSAAIFDRAEITEASGRPDMVPTPGIYPHFTWGITPYAELSIFDPDNPVRAEFGLKASAKYQVTPSFVLSGAVTKAVWGNIGREDLAPSNLPRVRSDATIYAREGDPAIEHLTAAWYARPGENLYGRVTVGYLEKMFGGVSAELLWKPMDSSLALGAELNWVQKRDYDLLLGFQDYSAATGHVSAYYDFGNGFDAKIHAGRYLAGDWGGTLAVDRVFDNGWRVGGYATFTSASAEDFGEGSFDKGIRFTVPLEWALGQPSRGSSVTDIRSLARDGGVRLNVEGRLYDWVKEGHGNALAGRWGKFWR
ncbi:hypothetical protein XMM3392_000443 [Aliiroseovarius sp. xm-m-339-2]|nr:hypothetical protein [Aliiroseovarius sp. xm-m-339-2]